MLSPGEAFTETGGPTIGSLGPHDLTTYTPRPKWGAPTPTAVTSEAGPRVEHLVTEEDTDAWVLQRVAIAKARVATPQPVVEPQWQVLSSHTHKEETQNPKTKPRARREIRGPIARQATPARPLRTDRGPLSMDQKKHRIERWEKEHKAKPARGLTKPQASSSKAPWEPSALQALLFQ